MNLQLSIKSVESEITFRTEKEYYSTIIAGKGMLCIDGNQYDIQPGDLMRIPGSVWVTVRPKTSITAGHMVLNDYYIPQVSFRLIRGSFAEKMVPAFLLGIQVTEMDLSNKNNLNTALSQFLLELISGITVDRGRYHPSVDTVLANIMDNYTDPEYDLTAVIAAIGYSAGYFRKIFKMDTGMTPIEFLNIKRLEFAKKLIWQEKGNLTLSECAMRSGFSDPGNFSKLFSKIQGESPKVYKDRILKTQG